MEKAIADGEFVESAQFGGNFYGTSKKAIQVRGQGWGVRDWMPPAKQDGCSP
jgi:hypothetical protein